MTWQASAVGEAEEVVVTFWPTPEVIGRTNSGLWVVLNVPCSQGSTFHSNWQGQTPESTTSVGSATGARSLLLLCEEAGPSSGPFQKLLHDAGHPSQAAVRPRGVEK